MTTKAFLALGSNLGDRLAILEKVRSALCQVLVIEKVSRIYETVPIGIVDQPLFLNQVLQGRTKLLPEELLVQTKMIENIYGRQRTIENGARTIDIDILSMDDQSLQTSELTLPHPRMFDRPFVLIPLYEIAPDYAIINPKFSLKKWYEKNHTDTNVWVYNSNEDR